MKHEPAAGWTRRALAALAVLLVLGLVGWGLATGVAGRRTAAEALTTQQAIMGTIVNITIVPEPGKTSATEAMARAVERLRRVEALMSYHIADSELSRVNREAGSKPVPVSPETAHVIREALRFGEITGGTFDVTVGPLVDLWKACAQEKRLPGEAEVQAARARVGYRRLHVSEDGTVRFGLPGMRIDLGGIAKGYAVDAAYREIAASGLRNAMVEAGGDLYAGGVRPDGKPWVIGVQDPRAGRDDPPSLVAALRVSDRAVATSGNYRRYSVIDGRRVSHILDPRTGGSADAVPSVTIVAADCTTADALATGVSVLGVEEGIKLVQSLPGVEALLISVEGRTLKFHRSRGFGALEAVTSGP